MVGVSFSNLIPAFSGARSVSVEKESAEDTQSEISDACAS